MSDLSLSVIMPALNEEKNIEAAVRSTFEAFAEKRVIGEIIVVNDGSSDKTPEIVQSLKTEYPSLSLLNHSKPMGIGHSFFDGVRNAKNDIVVMFPGDNENDPNDALNYLFLLRQVDIVVPFIHNIEVRRKMRRLLSSLYRFIINITFGINLNYTNGTVFYRRHILNDITLKSFGFFYQAELLIKLIRQGYLFAEVPNFLSIRNDGKSKATTFKSLIRVMKSYLQIFINIYITADETGKKRIEFLHPLSVSFAKYSKLSKGSEHGQ